MKNLVNILLLACVLAACGGRNIAPEKSGATDTTSAGEMTMAEDTVSETEFGQETPDLDEKAVPGPSSIKTPASQHNDPQSTQEPEHRHTPRDVHQPVLIDPSFNPEGKVLVKVTSAKIVNRALQVEFTYAGSCSYHHFELYSPTAEGEKLQLYLVDTRPDDPCPDLKTGTAIFGIDHLTKGKSALLVRINEAGWITVKPG